MRRIVGLAAAATLVWAMAGCVVGSDDGGTTGGRTVPPPTGAKQTATKALKDIERFWTATYPEVSGGRPFKPVTGGYHPYTETLPPPACGGEQPGEYQPNAFYCPAGDFIAWDAQNLIPQLQSDFGPLLVGVVLAHEYGHAIQYRLRDTEQPTVVLEQQADCYAGTWTADALAGRSTAYRNVTPTQLDNTVGGLLLLRDQPGTPAQAQGAHGNAFDRVRAFQDGVQKGPKTCAAYRADTVPVTEVPFGSVQDQVTGGDLPYGQAVRELSADAQAYWDRTFPRLAGSPWQQLRVEPFTGSPPDCRAPDKTAGGQAFYCPDGLFVAFDNRRLGPLLYQRIGDNAVGMLLGDLFARAAQDQRGRSTQDRAGQLAVDCLAGTWTGDLLRRGNAGQGELSLSPGDLDEAVAALLAFGRAGGQNGTTAFDRIAAYRDGVLTGLSACPR